MSLLAEFHISSLLPLCIMLPVTVMMMLRVYRRLGTRNKSVPQTRLQVRQQRSLESRTLGEQSPPQLAQWEVQMHETTRELSARLDNKMRSLSHLIELTENASDRLEQLLAETAHRTENRSLGDPITQSETVVERP